MLVLKTPEELHADRELKIKSDIESFKKELRDAFIAKLSFWKGDSIEVRPGSYGLALYSTYKMLNYKERRRAVIEIINELRDYNWMVRYDTEGDTIEWIQINQEDRWFMLLFRKIFGTKKERGSGLLNIS